MAKAEGLFVQGEVLGIETFGQVHAKVHVHAGNGSVITATMFGDKAKGTCSPVLADIQKAGERSSVKLALRFKPAEGNYPASFEAIGLVPLGQ